MAHEEIITTSPTAEQKANHHLNISRVLNRRNFMAGLGIAGATAAGAGLMAGCSSSNNPATVVAAGVAEADVLNFALNLEYFEATLYSYYVNGTDLPAASTSASGSTAVSGTVKNPPPKLTNLPNLVLDMLNEVLFDEINHVNDLRSLLGPGAIARPNLDLSALTAANYLSMSRLIEDVGVTAYTGAVTLLPTAANIQAAAQILAVEAFHSGAFRLLSIQSGTAYSGGTPDGYDVKPADAGTQVLAQAGPTTALGSFFATAGANGATTAQTGTFPAFAYKRTTSQVLSIVYGNTAAGTAAGGFFPNGLNGNIKAV